MLGGGEEHCKQISLACVGSACSVWVTLGFAHGMCAFLVYTSQAPDYSAGELFKEGPGLRALPRAKLLSFRFSGTPQRHTLGWVCVLCLSQGQAAQVTRCLANALFKVCGVSYHLPGLGCSVSWVRNENAHSAVLCASSGS